MTHVHRHYADNKPFVWRFLCVEHSKHFQCDFSLFSLQWTDVIITAVIGNRLKFVIHDCRAINIFMIKIDKKREIENP